MSWLDIKYVTILSNNLRNFKRKSPNLYNFSCPICGDSESNSKRSRGYIYNKSNKLIYHCHNCSASMSVEKFIQTINPSLYKDYVLEKIKDSKNTQQLDLEEFESKMKPLAFSNSSVLNRLKKVSSLSPFHPVKKFVEKRKIPNQYHVKLFACPSFMEYTNSLIPNKFSKENLKYDECKLLIPFINSNNRVHAYQGRSLENRSPKYITIILDESVPKLYGLDTVNLNKTTYVFEGPLDSTFIPNSIATAGGDIVSSLKGFSKENLVIVYDNEPRSKETVYKMDKSIMQGYNICIWPENMEKKDVNDMILSGLSSEFIEYIIQQNIYKDLQAKLMLTKWSKV